MRFFVTLFFHSFLIFFIFFDRANSGDQSNRGFIDVHVHIIGGKGFNEDIDGAIDVTINHMNKLGIGKAIILPPPQVTTQNWYDYPAYLESLANYPGRLFFLGGGGQLNSFLHKYKNVGAVTPEVKNKFSETAKQIIKDGAKGFGEIASLHISAAPGHPFEFVPADHPLLKTLATLAATLDVPIDLHMDATINKIKTPLRFTNADNPPTLPPTIASLARLLEHNTKAKIVWAHGGSDPLGSMSTKIIMELMNKYPNLYVSLRVVGGRAPMNNKILAFGEIDEDWLNLLKHHSDRFVVGSDSFFVAPTLRGKGPGVRFSQRNVPKLRATRHFLSLLPPDLFKKVAWENAVRIYKLE